MATTAITRPLVVTKATKSVTWAPEGQLKQIKLFEPASYEDTITVSGFFV